MKNRCSGHWLVLLCPCPRPTDRCRRRALLLPCMGKLGASHDCSIEPFTLGSPSPWHAAKKVTSSAPPWSLYLHAHTSFKLEETVFLFSLVFLEEHLLSIFPLGYIQHPFCEFRHLQKARRNIDFCVLYVLPWKKSLKQGSNKELISCMKWGK